MGDSLIRSSPFASQVAGGDYARVAESALAGGLESVRDLDVAWVIASLCWLGRSTEAEGIWLARAATLSGEAATAARFFIAVAQCREGKHDKARQLFTKNLAENGVEVGDLSAFFAAQGMAFYRYSTGRLAKAQLWSERALKAAAGADFAFGRVLASELLGHVQLCRGLVRAGFRSMHMAVQGAEKLGQGALLQMMQTSETLYRSTFGHALSADGQAAELTTALANCQFDDSYTKASLLIELTRVRLLQGQTGQAHQLLETASDLVYRIDNPDLEIEHNLCVVSLLRRRGDLFQALTLVRSCHHRARTRQDIRMHLKVLGAEVAVLGELGRIDEQSALLPKVEALTRASDALLSHRMLARARGERLPASRPGEDPLGDLIDEAHETGAGAVAAILRRGWLGLLPAALAVAPQEDVLYFDLEPGALTIFERGEVRHLVNGCSELIRKLLTSLGAGEASKETLTLALWGRTYNPLRHDALIYGLVAKTRKLLGQAAPWIESIDAGYRLRPGVRVQAKHFELPPPAPVLHAQTIDAELNYRQNLIFGWLTSGEVLEARTITDRLGISDATASRDLGGLVERGLAFRLGRGKATKYRSNHDA